MHYKSKHHNHHNSNTVIVVSHEFESVIICTCPQYVASMHAFLPFRKKGLFEYYKIITIPRLVSIPRFSHVAIEMMRSMIIVAKPPETLVMLCKFYIIFIHSFSLNLIIFSRYVFELKNFCIYSMAYCRRHGRHLKFPRFIK